MQTIDCLVPGLCVREPRARQRATPAGGAALEEHLAAMLERVRLAHSAVVSCVATLRYQNCELDEDVARLLQRCVSDVLGEQIEETEELLASRSTAS